MVDKVIFVPRANIETIEGWKGWAVISIIEPDLERVRLGKNWAHVLRMKFHDTDPNHLPNLEEFENRKSFMTNEQAEQIVSFIRNLPDDVEGIVVQCLAGMSRSAAVAKWIAGEFRIPFDRQYDKYNKHVYQLMINAGKIMKKDV